MRINKNRLRINITLLFFILTLKGKVSFAQEETITITTYYPSPYGVYSTLRLVPREPPVCDDNQKGLIYFDDNTDLLRVCGGEEIGFRVVGGLWALEKSKLFPQDTGWNVGIGTKDPKERLHIVGGDLRIGASIPGGSTDTGYGRRLYFSGGPFQGYFGDNSDALWIARYDAGNDVSELRVYLGDNAAQPSLAEKFVVGAKDWISDTDWIPTFTVVATGRVGINNTNPSYALDVNGDIRVSGDILTDEATYPDYVFQPDYELMSLEELKKFIAQHRRLPGMPSAEEIRKRGMKLFEQNRLLLEKLEEAYLYIIELEERIRKLEDYK